MKWEKKLNTTDETLAMEEDNAQWKRLSRHEAYDNPWITVHHDEVVNPNGGHGIYGNVHFKNLAIGIIPVDENGWTWLVGQHRYPLDYYSWEIPEGGGLLERDPLDSAKRELREEVGLNAEHWKKIIEFETSNSVTDERAIIYVAEGLSNVGQDLDETEKLDIMHLPLEDAIGMVDNGEITDSLSVVGLMWMARKYGKHGE
ncbi:NUDIX domain-containing protein [Phaeocystidibacter luteus]|nr:NUDIX hydrolase [Phaeocystidibacter luteus]